MSYHRKNEKPRFHGSGCLRWYACFCWGHIRTLKLSLELKKGTSLGKMSSSRPHVLSETASSSASMRRHYRANDLCHTPLPVRNKASGLGALWVLRLLKMLWLEDTSPQSDGCLRPKEEPWRCLHVFKLNMNQFFYCNPPVEVKKLGLKQADFLNMRMGKQLILAPNVQSNFAFTSSVFFRVYLLLVLCDIKAGTIEKSIMVDHW